MPNHEAASILTRRPTAQDASCRRRRRAGGARRAPARRAGAPWRWQRGGRSCMSRATASRLATLEQGAGVLRPRHRGAELSRLGLPALRSRVAQRRDHRRRIATLAALARPRASEPSRSIVLTTVNAIVQRVPPRDFIAGSAYARARQCHEHAALIARLEIVTAMRAPAPCASPANTPCAAASSISSAGPATPVRLDFFGDTLESIRGFDPDTQRTTGALDRFELRPVSEVPLDAGRRSAASAALRRAFGAGRPATTRSTKSVSAGRRIPAWSTGCRCSTTGWRRCSTICRTRRSRSTTRRRGARPSGSSRSPTITMRARRRSSARPSARRPTGRCRPSSCSSSEDDGRRRCRGRAVRQLSTVRAARDAGAIVSTSAAGRAATSPPSAPDRRRQRVRRGGRALPSAARRAASA